MDKNGRVVTRHVLSNSPESGKRALPSPTLKQPLRAALMYASMVVDLLHSKDGHGNLIRYNGEYQYTPPETLARVMSEVFSPRILQIASRLLFKGRNETRLNLTSGLLQTAESVAGGVPAEAGMVSMIERHVEEARILDAAGLDENSDTPNYLNRESVYILKVSAQQAQNMIIERVRQGHSLPRTEEEQEVMLDELKVALLLRNAATPKSTLDMPRGSESYEELTAIYKARDMILHHFDEMEQRGGIDLGLLNELSASPTQALRGGTL